MRQPSTRHYARVHAWTDEILPPGASKYRWAVEIWGGGPRRPYRRIMVLDGLKADDARRLRDEVNQVPPGEIDLYLALLKFQEASDNG